MSAEPRPQIVLDDLAIVRDGLTPRGHHRLCRVNMPTPWSSKCNCPRDEVEEEHAALDRIEALLRRGTHQTPVMGAPSYKIQRQVAVLCRSADGDA